MNSAPNLVCGYHLTILRPFEVILGPYLYYALAGQASRYQFTQAANGVTRFGLSQQGIKNVAIAFPSLEEQKQIVEFLEHKTAQIDALIEKKRALVEKLNEQRTAAITEAVTKSSNPCASLKSTEVEWLGEVPEHWHVERLKFSVSHIGSGKTPTGGATVYVDSGVLLLRSQNVYDDGLRLDDGVFITDEADTLQSASRVQADDVLLNITGASIGRTSLVPKDFVQANVNQHVCIIRPNKGKIEPAFLHLLLSSHIAKAQIAANENGTSREGLTFPQVGDLLFALPSTAEQKEVVAFVNLESKRVRELTRKTNDTIEKLREYRTSTVTAAVTGQIDVRNFNAEDALPSVAFVNPEHHRELSEGGA